jgi:hypothetical protein
MEKEINCQGCKASTDGSSFAPRVEVNIKEIPIIQASNG